MEWCPPDTDYTEAPEAGGIYLHPQVLALGLKSRFKDSAESETSRPSQRRLGPLRDESESRVGRLNSEETDSAENRSWLGRLGIMMILCLIAIQRENNYISMYLWM